MPARPWNARRAPIRRLACRCGKGVSGALWKAAKVLTAASLVLTLMPGRHRTAAGVCGVLGGLALRFAVFHAGKASALDPRATFAQQQ